MKKPPRKKVEAASKKDSLSPFTLKVLKLIKKIPKGKVASYGQIAALAGNPRGARQVSWILHSSSKTQALPWHRIINSRGMISLEGAAGKRQLRLLREEGVEVDARGIVDGERFWRGGGEDAKKNPLH